MLQQNTATVFHNRSFAPIAAEDRNSTNMRSKVYFQRHQRWWNQRFGAGSSSRRCRISSGAISAFWGRRDGRGDISATGREPGAATRDRGPLVEVHVFFFFFLYSMLTHIEGGFWLQWLEYLSCWMMMLCPPDLLNGDREPPKPIPLCSW